jgi:hypothetical protein
VVFRRYGTRTIKPEQQFSGIVIRRAGFTDLAITQAQFGRGQRVIRSYLPL